MTVRTSRRELLRVMGTAAALSAAGTRPAWPQADKRIRYAAHSAEGKAMLAIYADAVRAMQDTAKYPEGDARSWMFQWYTHSVRGDRSKAAEIKRVYKSNAPAAAKALAEAMWSTCEPHFDMNGTRAAFFLPWHRMYLHCFEDIVREVSGKPTFTLPFWDYTDPDPARRIVPEEFRKKGDAKWGGLHRETRHAYANQGKPIDGPGGQQSEMSLAATNSDTYGDNGAGDAGMCANLDGGLHGAVHVNVGNFDNGMGTIEWAAGDPLFWIHHCNIDRVWAGWNMAGGLNPALPAFLKESFTFADASGKAVKVSVEEMFTRMEPTYEPALDIGRTIPKPGPMPVAQAIRFEVEQPVQLKPKAPSVVQIGPAKQGVGGAPLPVSGLTPAQADKGATFTLRLEGLTASKGRAGSFDVHAGTVDPAKATRQQPSYLGSVNFFGAAQAHAGSHGAHGKTVSMKVSAEARAILEKGGVKPSITFVPTSAQADGTPSIAKVVLVAR